MTAAELNEQIRDNMLAVVPVGVVLPFAGSSAPTSLYLLCDGAAVSRTTYAALFSILSTAYGSGDGTTTFNVPDLRGRLPVGLNSGGAAEVNALGNNDGRAANQRSVRHRHTWTRGNGNSIGGTLGNFPSFDTVGTDYTTSGDTNNTDSPAYLVLNYIIKALES